MKPTTANFAFQLDPKDRFGISADSGEILASKKAEVVLANGSSRRVTVFFRVPPERLPQLRAMKQAESAKSTAESFKHFLVEQGLTKDKAELALGKITAHSEQVDTQSRNIRRQSESSLKRQQLGQTAAPARRVSLGKLKQVFDGGRGMRPGPSGSHGPQIPVGLFGKLFAGAMERGTLLRVDDSLRQTSTGPGVGATSGRKASGSSGPMRYKPLPPTPDRPALRASRGKPLPATPIATGAEPRIPKDGMPPLPPLPSKTADE